MNTQPQSTLGNRNYKNDKQWDPAKTLIVTAAGSVTGIVLGFIASLVGHDFFYLIFSFPIMIGLLLGAVIGKTTYYVKSNNVATTAIATIVCSLLTVGGLRYADYMLYQKDYAEANPGQHMPVESFPAFIKYQVESGTTICVFTRRGRVRTRGAEVGSAGTLGFWFLEGLLIAGTSLLLSTYQAKRPFCSSCNQWCKEFEIGVFHMPVTQVVDAIATGRLSVLNPNIRRDDTTPINLFSCETCEPGTECIVGIDSVERINDNLEVTNEGYFLISRCEAAHLFRMFGHDDIVSTVFSDVVELYDESHEFVETDDETGEPVVSESEDYMAQLMQRQKELHNNLS